MINQHGYEVIKVHPRASYLSLKRLGKSKVGKRWVKVRRLTGYNDLIVTGSPLVNEKERKIYMHQDDYEKLKAETEAAVWLLKSCNNQ